MSGRPSAHQDDPQGGGRGVAGAVDAPGEGVGGAGRDVAEPEPRCSGAPRPAGRTYGEDAVQDLPKQPCDWGGGGGGGGGLAMGGGRIARTVIRETAGVGVAMEEGRESASQACRQMERAIDGRQRGGEGERERGRGRERGDEGGGARERETERGKERGRERERLNKNQERERERKIDRDR